MTEKSQTDKPSISARENGPYVARGITSMTDADGNDLGAKPVMALCRCGQSKNKPFCDGTHKEIGFDSSRGDPAGKDRLLVYQGAEVTVTYNPRLCSHAAECGRLAGHVFDPGQRPWVQPDNGTVEEIRAVVAACPSGALALAAADGPEQLIPDRAQITVERNGPLWVTGVDAPADPAGEGMSGGKYVLCRCGLSGNKPYCDGSHRDRGWRDDG